MPFGWFLSGALRFCMPCICARIFRTTHRGLWIGPNIPMRAGMGMRRFVRIFSATGMCRGDFNPAPAVPVWPFLEWVLFFFTGVTVEAARGLAVAFFFANLLLSYLLLRAQRTALDGAAGTDAAGDQPVSLLLQPAGDSGADADGVDAGSFESGVRLPRMRRPVLGVGLGWTAVHADDADQDHGGFSAAGAGVGDGCCRSGRTAGSCCAARRPRPGVCSDVWAVDGAGGPAGLMADYKYLFFVNKYLKPPEFYWPLVSFWWSFHGGLWVDPS